MTIKPVNKKRSETISEQEAASRRVFSPWMLIVAIPLGLVMFFSLGWLFQSHWYWYFGLDVARLGLPFFILLEESLAMAVSQLMFILIIYGVLFILRLIGLYLKNIIFGDRRIGLTELFSIPDFIQRNIHVAILLYIVSMYIIIQRFEVHFNGLPVLYISPDIFVLELCALPLAVILFVRLLADLLSLMPMKFKHRLRIKSDSGINDGILRVLLGILAAYAMSAAFTSFDAVGEASLGCRDDGGCEALRRVYIESDYPITGLNPYRQVCDCGSYIYGPMGFLADNKDSIFLVPWKAANQKYFPYPPDLYQIERSPTRVIDIIPRMTNP